MTAIIMIVNALGKIIVHFLQEVETLTVFDGTQLIHVQHHQDNTQTGMEIFM